MPLKAVTASKFILVFRRKDKMKNWYCSQERRRLTPEEMDSKEHCGNCPRGLSSGELTPKKIHVSFNNIQFRLKVRQKTWH